MTDISPVDTSSFPVEVLVVGVTSLTAIAVAVITSLANRDRRAQLLSDLRILEKLEAGSDAHGALKQSIDRRILATSDTGAKTRDWFGTILGVLFVIVGLGVLQFVNSLGGWWLVLHIGTGFFLLFGVVGIVTGIRKAPRDERGRVIKS